MEKKEKISDLPSYTKIRNDAKGFYILGKVIKVFSLFGPKNPELKEALSKLPELKKQAEFLSQMPDKFNEHFSSQGWIAHESMNAPLMERTLELAESNNAGQAEIELAEHFTSPTLNLLINQFKAVPEFAIRYKLIRLACQDTLEKRFHSAVPLLLMITDGVVNDISKSKGFFSENTDLSAWYSIAALSSGLTAVRDIFNETRKKTNSEEIFLPYRNGILHGRDLKYDNPFVVGKCWCTLFAIKDWAQALRKQKENPPIPEKKLTLRESLAELKKVISDYKVHKIEHAKILRTIDDWKPRDFTNTIIEPSTFKQYSPEKEVYDFAVNWQNKNYGKIALQKYYFGKKEVNIAKEAGNIRSDFKDKILKEFEIVSIKDEAPAVTEVTLKIKYSIDSVEKEKNIVMRMICKDINGRAGINGLDNVEWRFIDGFINSLYF